MINEIASIVKATMQKHLYCNFKNLCPLDIYKQIHQTTRKTPTLLTQNCKVTEIHFPT